jgi:muramoyltetrapeptide carboxypeptidase LdcA involved in peptidoglycan recycling
MVYTNYKKPQRIKKGDAVAVLSPSWGGPSAFPLVYERGLEFLQESGLLIKEFTSTRLSADELYMNPNLRASDINAAFADKEVKAIFSTIGGDDSMRILPYLDSEIIKDNPKIFMGYSDTTTMLVYMNLLGLVSFHGPAIMAGFSQIESLPIKFKEHLTQFLFNNYNGYEYKAYPFFCDGYPNWSISSSVGQINTLKLNEGWHFLNGSGVFRGQLFGGCLEVLEFLKHTKYFPKEDFWYNKILFFETSELKPSVLQVRWILRNYGLQGVLHKISAILFGRARDYSLQEKMLLDQAIKDVVITEFGIRDLPIVTNMDFGHTDPQFILPLGIFAELNITEKTLRLVEPYFSD